MNKISLKRRSVLFGTFALGIVSATSLHAHRRTLRWSTQDQIDFSAFVPKFASEYDSEIDCADLAIDALITFAARNSLPVRLFDFDNPPPNRKRWLTFDPRIDDWQTKRSFMMQQLGAINVIENTQAISLNMARAGDLILHENPDGIRYTGHTRLLVSAHYDPRQLDYRIVRYEGDLPPVVPRLINGWYKDIDNVFGNSPRRWNFGQFGMA
jgi:hypothetical protein